MCLSHNVYSFFFFPPCFYFLSLVSQESQMYSHSLVFIQRFFTSCIQGPQALCSFGWIFVWPGEHIQNASHFQASLCFYFPPNSLESFLCMWYSISQEYIGALGSFLSLHAHSLWSTWNMWRAYQTLWLVHFLEVPQLLHQSTIYPEGDHNLKLAELLVLPVDLADSVFNSGLYNNHTGIHSIST